jgi:integrase/recombinase XerC
MDEFSAPTALALRPMDLDVEQCLIMLREKGGTFGRQPVSPTSCSTCNGMPCNAAHPAADSCCATGRDNRSAGAPTIICGPGLGTILPWAATQQVSAHGLRHTTLTWVERVFGYGVALAYAGHAETPNDAGTTARYVKATLEEVATALAVLTGEPHPLAIPTACNRTTSPLTRCPATGEARTRRCAAGALIDP